jgi:molybdate transport system ATP-binding protein
MLEASFEKRIGGFHLHVNFSTHMEFLAILGESGCGKSLTLKCLAGLLTPDKGKIVLNGKILFDSDKKINLPPGKRNVGYMFQNYSLFPNMNVIENIACGIKKRRPDTKMRISYLIQKFHLDGLEHHFPNQLSGGQQQRVAFARMIASEPKLVLMDEPFSALDSSLKWKLKMNLMDMLENYKGDTLLVSHDKDDVFNFCNKVSILEKGKMQKIYPMKRIYNNPNTLAEARLSGRYNISRVVKLDANTLKAVDWNIEIQYPQNFNEKIRYVAIKPEHISLVIPTEKGNAMKCTVKREIQCSDSNIVQLENYTGSSEYIRWKPNHEEWDEDDQRSIVDIYFNQNKLLLLEA